jgi:hypothetical protein
MAKPLEKPSISAGGLVTVAFLKAQLDSGGDHLGIFFPVVVDAARSFGQDSFAKSEVQERLSQLHGVAMPQHVIATLLDRSIKKNLVSRESGRYRAAPAMDSVPPISGATGEILASQTRLGERLKEHATRRGLDIPTPEVALEVLLRFLETEQVDILLGGTSGATGAQDASHRERVVTAEFIHDVAAEDSALSSSLNRMLEGLVLYHAAFLPDLSATSRKFKDLRVSFDSSLVRQALGLEGEAAKTLMTETIGLLKDANVQCLVFEKTIDEIRRILAFYENHLGTSAGRRVIRSGAMARHLLTQRFTPGDIRQISALIEISIQKAGFAIAPMPPHQKPTTGEENKLAKRLASAHAKGEEVEARVQHDVDCVAAVLTLRRGYRSSALENARAVFAADQPLVIRNVVRWWIEDEKESGIEPIVHIRAIANLAWLKKPAFSTTFKLRELVSLCSAALRPSKETWKRFLKHLEKLQQSADLTEDEMTAIVVSATSDKLLREAEVADGDDIDSTTLDEIVERVKQEYAGNASAEREALVSEHNREMVMLGVERDEAMAAQHRRARAIETRRTLARTRATGWAKNICLIMAWAVNIFLGIAVVGILIEHLGAAKSSAVMSWITVGAIAIFYLLEFAFLRKEVGHLMANIESALADRFSLWLDPESKYDDLL